MRQVDRVGDAARTARLAELGQRVLDTAPVVILVFNDDAKIEYVNPYFERLTGYRLAELEGEDWIATFVPEADRDRLRGLLRERLQRSGSVRGRVNPIITRSGERRAIEWTDELLHDADGRVVGVLATGHDVTEREAAQAALRLSESRLAEAHRIAKVGAWEFDVQTRAVWYSDEHYRMHGLKLGSPVSRRQFVSLVHPDDRPIIAHAFDVTVAEGEWEGEYRIVLPTGEVRHSLGRARTSYGPNGEPVLLAGTTQDITERKRTEDAARRVSELLRTVVARAPITLFALDREGVVTLVEGRSFSKLGFEPSELIGAPALLIYKDQQRFVDAFYRALGGDRTVLAVHMGESDLEVVCVPSIDARGAIEGVIGVAFDVTKHKQVEARLQASVAAQRTLVAELREADRRKSEFIAVLSHELRNPLGAIRNGLYVLDEVEPGGEQARRALAIMDRQVGQLARLVDDLLDVSRITQAKVALQRAPLDLAGLVRTVIDDHQAMFTIRGLTLQSMVPDTPLVVDGDPVRLTQVIGNLLHNAAKFTPAGGRATVSLTSDPASGSIELRIADTGTGIDAVMLDRLFQPFVQADRTLARSKGGLGLGLALVKGLVELHGGEVDVRSDGEGRGAEFVVRLRQRVPEPV